MLYNMLSFAIILCLGALASSAPQKLFYSLEEADVHFENFVKTYNKEYKSEAEKLARFEIFKNNLVNINENNMLDQGAIHGINEFTDLTKEEFGKMYNGLLNGFGGEGVCLRSTYNASGLSAPDSWDWRVQNRVTPVKAQSSCGSCWAFSAAATIEGQHAMIHNELINVSPQQILDCTKHSLGCVGGWSYAAISELSDAGGIMTDQEYPYVNQRQTCRADPSRFAVKVTGCRQFYPQSEEELKEILAQIGPLSIGVAAESWPSYSGGIKSMCPGVVNHAVLLVGYGSEGGMPYWLIKNSYGTGWGEGGYIRMSRNTNTCNIMSGTFVTASVQ